MRVLRDYHCDNCKHTFEVWAEYQQPMRCSQCGAYAESIISGTSFSLPGADTGFPTAADKWARRHREANREGLKELNIPT